MTHHDRNAHADLIATARGMLPRNTPAKRKQREAHPHLCATLYYATLCALATILFWSLQP